ncbi:endonuclease VII domain-containing protein [Promicromonospora iranensis]|uniref:Recombination endonuclease VII n=1 Tax=Promicromonospora iranensis TaxID=1105144 RepID=A0ABU2CVA4_9MICO|nr:endonuclease VII domain-containing protein [Promicromonospora iranensis]MDR7385216.1 hypothetical protein [Promicromonospora iranensis]
MTKPLDDFWTEPRKRDGRHSACKECMHVQQRDRTLRRKYGIGSAEYDALVEAQQGRCGVCGEPDARRPLVVDHCHRSGQVRALLCDRCNRLLGVADDDIALLEHAIQFLHKHRGPTAPK